MKKKQIEELQLKIKGLRVEIKRKEKRKEKVISVIPKVFYAHVLYGEEGGC